MTTFLWLIVFVLMFVAFAVNSIDDDDDFMKYN